MDYPIWIGIVLFILAMIVYIIGMVSVNIDRSISMYRYCNGLLIISFIYNLLYLSKEYIA